MGEQPIIVVQGLTKRFGGVVAVSDVSFEMCRGEILGLIGPNGAGKTTLLSLLTGFLKPNEGSIRFRGAELNGSRPYQIARMGLVRTFQMVTVYSESTVEENVLKGMHYRNDLGLWSAILGKGFDHRRGGKTKEQVDEIVELFDLKGMMREKARVLSYGHQKALGLAIALASDPSCLLLDEPAAGMNPEETRWMGKVIQTLNSRGMSILLIEHDMKMVMSLCHRIVVLNYGAKIAEGTPCEIQADEAVIKAYLGADHGDTSN
jgi:branched-chain amino acid transport system ATP-binding protein